MPSNLFQHIKFNNINRQMALSKLIDPLRFWQLFSGIFGIYFSYLVTGVVHQAMLKGEYTNDFTGKGQKFSYPSAFLFIPCGITWVMGQALNVVMIKKDERVVIPGKKAVLCAITVIISTLTYTYAIYLTNYPIVMMFKSCNILSVILVGVLCSRVTDKKLKLGVQKIAIGMLITLGIVLFKVYDPQSSKNADEKKTEWLGIGLLLVSLLADGFLPDLQAEIKSVYKPQPMQMMSSINKWVTIVSVLYSLVLYELHHIFIFLYQHNKFLINLFLMGFLSTLGQIFVYRMIKQFKQHFVPFVITTRKIFTVGLSILWFGHQTNLYQIFGLLMVFGIVSYEFISQLMEEKAKQGESLLLGESESGPIKAPRPQTFQVQQQEQKLRKDGQQQQQVNSIENQVVKQRQVYQQRNNLQSENMGGELSQTV